MVQYLIVVFMYDIFNVEYVIVKILCIRIIIGYWVMFFFFFYYGMYCNLMYKCLQCNFFFINLLIEIGRNMIILSG